MKAQYIQYRATIKQINAYTKLVAWISIVIFLILSSNASAQTPFVGAYTQKTIAGLQQGAEIGFSSAHQFGLGVYFQSTEWWNLESGIHNYPYYGLFAEIPIKQDCEGLSVLLRANAGLADNQFVVVTPAIITQVKLTDWLNLRFNMSMRAGHAAIGSSVLFNLKH